MSSDNRTVFLNCMRMYIYLIYKGYVNIGNNCSGLEGILHNYACQS